MMSKKTSVVNTKSIAIKKTLFIIFSLFFVKHVLLTLAFSKTAKSFKNFVFFAMFSAAGVRLDQGFII